MTRQEAEKLIGSRVEAWTAANGVYVGELVRVVPRRPWRGVVRITGVLRAATAWEVRRVRQRRGFRTGEEIEVGGVNIKPTEATGTTYLEVLRADLADLKRYQEQPGLARGWWLKPSIEAREREIVEEEAREARP
jgi:hypothetical protein